MNIGPDRAESGKSFVNRIIFSASKKKKYFIVKNMNHKDYTVIFL